MPCRCDDIESDEGYWNSYIKVLMTQLIDEIKNHPNPRGWMPEEVHKSWIEAFSHLLSGCPEKLNYKIKENIEKFGSKVPNSIKDKTPTELTFKEVERIIKPYDNDPS